MRVWLALVLFLASGAAMGGGAPADPDLPPPDPPGYWRKISQDDPQVTGSCIGRVDTLACAVETARACVSLRISRLCALAWREPEANWSFGAPRHKRYSNLLRIENIERISANTLLPHRGDWDLRPGDIAVFVRIRECDLNVCESDIPPKYPLTLDFVNSGAVQGMFAPRDDWDFLIPEIMVFRKEEGGWRFRGKDMLIPGDRPPFQ